MSQIKVYHNGRWVNANDTNPLQVSAVAPPAPYHGEMWLDTSTTPSQVSQPGYNYLINPSFEVNQRGVTSVNTNGLHPMDQWVLAVGGSSATASQQPFEIGQTSVPGEPRKFLRVVVTSSAGAGNIVLFYHPIEFVRTLAGQSAVLSFYGRANTPKPISVELNQDFGTGGTTAVYSIGVSKITLSTTWTRYYVPVTFPSISGKTIGTSDHLKCIFWLDAGSNFNSRTNSLGQNCTTEVQFEFANVKLEAGTVATPFVVPRYGDELIKCMRYLQIIGCNTHADHSSSQLVAGIYLPVSLRAYPTLTTSLPEWNAVNPSGNQIGAFNRNAGAWATISGTLGFTIGSFNSQYNNCILYLTATSFSGSAGNGLTIVSGIDCKLYLSAEL